MSTLRDGIAREVVRRLAAISGWSASQRADEETSNVPILAVVATTGESKVLVDSMFYTCTLSIAVLVVARAEDTSATLDGGNQFRYLDRLIALAEAAMHSTAWANEEQVTLQGHSVDDPDNSTRCIGELHLQVVYRHNVADPTIYNPSYTP